MIAAPSDRTGAPSGDLVPRILSAAVLAPVVLAAVYFGGLPLAILAAAASIILMLEWLHMTRHDARGLTGGLAVAAVGVGVLAAGATLLAPGAVIVLIAAIGIYAATRDSWLAAGIVYASIMAISLLAIRFDAEHGLAAVLFVLAVVWATDVGAFAAGRAVGGPKLWPAVSPKKTWAGFAGGLAAALAVGLIAAGLMGARPGIAIAAVIIALSLACQAGDLFESAVKRRFGVKDASRLIPGHGGLLDRVDGLTFAAPLAAIVGLIHAGPGRIGGGLIAW